MVTAKVKTSAISDSLELTINTIKAGHSFILEAGAGSGKTWTLIEVLKFILKEYGVSLIKNNQHIACITYTNVAANEIHERIENDPLVFVSTIHEFLWSVIEKYQSELRAELIEYNKSEAKKPVEDLENLLVGKTIVYSKFGKKYEEGRITHDDVIHLSEKIFNKYPKILKIVADQYPFIFVDEYQDTQQETVDLLLKNLLPNSKKFVVGFFGDSMQKIYGEGIGEIKDNQLTIITKQENFRCSQIVINLLNKIRIDLQQIPTGHNLPGDLIFLHCNNNLGNDNNNYENAVEYLKNKKGWKINSQSTKFLMLTHKGIASKLDYTNLLDAYGKLSMGRERLYEREERFSSLLIDKLEKIVYLYEQKKYGEFIELLGIEGFKIQKHEDKNNLKELMQKLIVIRKTGNIEEILKYVFENRLISKPERITEFEEKIGKPELDEETAKKKDFYDSLMKIKYQEIINLNGFIQNYTPFSTKHGVKGAEYENVLVVIDDNAWNMFKFNNVFSGDHTNEERFKRTLNLLYVCCSRAKDKLAILSLSEMDSSALATIHDWFGSGNVLSINDI